MPKEALGASPRSVDPRPTSQTWPPPASSAATAHSSVTPVDAQEAAVRLRRPWVSARCGNRLDRSAMAFGGRKARGDLPLRVMTAAKGRRDAGTGRWLDEGRVYGITSQLELGC